VTPYFGAKINRRKGSIGLDPDVVEDVGMKWGDEEDRVVVKIGDTREKMEEITLNKFFLWDPELLTMVVNDLVLMRVAVDGISTSGSGKEVGEEID